MDPRDQRQAWLHLSLAEPHARCIGLRLATALGSPQAAVEASQERLGDLLGPRGARRMRTALRAARPRAVLGRARDEGQDVLTPADPRWPALALAGLADVPCALYLRGVLPAADEATAALVGTRDATPYGLRVARELARGLAAAGLWVVSGLALGVDGAAHEGALDGGGATLAVLGCGLDHPYPVAHLDLREQMVSAGGGLLSEHPPGTAPRKSHFPRRNRLVAALSGAVVVVEAAARSGALITARLALDQGREVLAVPGSIYEPRRAGCHRLLREGAGLCESTTDILAALGLAVASPEAAALPPLEGPAARVWQALDDAEPRDAGAVCIRVGLDVATVAGALMALEVAGRARRLPGAGFVRS